MFLLYSLPKLRELYSYGFTPFRAAEKSNSLRRRDLLFRLQMSYHFPTSFSAECMAAAFDTTSIKLTNSSYAADVEEFLSGRLNLVLRTATATSARIGLLTLINCLEKPGVIISIKPRT